MPQKWKHRKGTSFIEMEKCLILTSSVVSGASTGIGLLGDDSVSPIRSSGISSSTVMGGLSAKSTYALIKSFTKYFKFSRDRSPS